MMVNHPKISVIIPCYNQAEYLPDALNSIYKQNYSNWECLIVNDGSTDNTEEIAQTWIHKDARYKYLESTNCGVSRARNLGVESSKGELIQFLDADDFLSPEKLMVSVKKMNSSNDSSEVVITNFKVYHEGLKQEIPPYCNLQKEVFDFHHILFNWEKDFTIPIYCGLFSATFFKDFRFPEDLKVKEDWIMWLNVFLNNPDVYFIDQPLGVSRKHQKSVTMSNSNIADQIIALDHVKKIVGEDEYELLLKMLIKRHYERSVYFKRLFLELKDKKIYKLDNFFKRIFYFLGLKD